MIMGIVCLISPVRSILTVDKRVHAGGERERGEGSLAHC